MDWRKFDLVEYRKGRYRLERQTWSFWDWCLMLFIAALLYRFWWVFLAIAAIVALGMLFILLAGVVLAFVSQKR